MKKKLYHHAVHTAAEHCSLRIRTLEQQWFINSLQIGPKTLKFLPMLLSFSLSDCLLHTNTNHLYKQLLRNRLNKTRLVLLLNMLPSRETGIHKGKLIRVKMLSSCQEIANKSLLKLLVESLSPGVLQC